MKRSARIAIYVLAGLASGLIIASVVLVFLSRTPFAMERVRRFALGWLDDQVEGEVNIGRITGRGLLGGITLHDFSIIDQRGRAFLAADSATLAYNWRTFVSGEIVIERTTMYAPKVYLEQLPGDSVWNFQHVFPDRTPVQEPPSRRRLILLNNARIIDGLTVVRIPFELNERIQAADTARTVIEQVPGGFARVLRFDSVNGEFSRIIWESPIELGKLVDVRSLRAKTYVWREAAQVTDLRGTVTLRDTILTFDFPNVRMPSTQAAIVGRVIMEEGLNFFDVRADSRRFAFRDMKWLYPRLPDEGGGSGVLRIQSQRPNGILWLATNTRISAPGTRMSGSFGVVTGDSMYFTNVDMRAAPLNLELIQAILPGRLPVEGLLVGTVEVKGPLSALETSGDVQLSQNGQRSGVKWRGTFDVREGVMNARNLRADLDQLDLAMLTALRPDLQLRGQLTGHVEANGSAARGITFAADIHHYLAGFTSSFDGDGVYHATGPDAGLDLRMNAQPLSFEQLAEAYPALARLQGDARGPIRLYGALDDLQLEAELATLAGTARVNGRLRRIDGKPEYVGEAIVSDFQLDRLIEKLPATSLTGTITFDVSGATIRNTTGPIIARLERGTVSALDFQNAQTVMMLDRGSLRVDSLSARTRLGDLSANGRISLLADRLDTLNFKLASDSVAYGSWGGSLAAAGALVGARGQVAGHFDAVGTSPDSTNRYATRALFEAREGGLYFRIDELSVGSAATPWQLAYPAHISVNDHGLTTDTLRIRREAGGSAQLSGRIAWHGTSHPSEAENVSDFRIDFEGLPFADFAHIKLQAMKTSGSIDGSVQITGTSASPIIDGDAVLRDLLVGEAELDSISGSIDYANRTLTTRLDALDQGKRIFFVDGTIPIDLSFTPVRERRLNQAVNFALTADRAPATLITGFVSGFHDVKGYVDGTLTAGGTTRKVTLGGELQLHDGDVRYDASGVRYRDVNGSFKLNDRTATVAASLRANGGDARVTGTIGFQTPRDPAFDLVVNATNFLAAKRKDAEFTTSGEVALTGRYRRPELTGNIGVGEGALFLDELYRRYQIVELDNPLLYDVVDTTIVALQSFLPPTQNPFVKNLIIRDLRVAVGRESWLRSRDLNVELTGELVISFLDSDPLASQRSVEDLRMLGSLRAVRGTYTLYSTGIARQFNLREGTVEFPGTPGMDPNLGFNAVYRARPLQGDPIDIVAVVGGTLRSPRVRLTSGVEPPISESDLASYLFFGLPTYALSPSQNAGVTQTIGGALTSSGFGYLASGLQTFAQNFGLLDYVALTAAEGEGPGISQQNALAGLFAGTRLELGRYIGDDVYIAASQRLTSRGTPGVRLEWRFLPTLTAEFFSEDRFARNPSFGIENSDLKRVWGMLLFREWSY